VQVLEMRLHLDLIRQIHYSLILDV
jgi:hypothetical protein